jgi:hypothetical protein
MKSRISRWRALGLADGVPAADVLAVDVLGFDVLGFDVLGFDVLGFMGPAPCSGPSGSSEQAFGERYHDGRRRANTRSLRG